MSQLKYFLMERKGAPAVLEYFRTVNVSSEQDINSKVRLAALDLQPVRKYGYNYTERTLTQ